MTQEKLLDIKDLTGGPADLTILNGVGLQIEPGKVHAIMGRNGSGKSTLAKILAGHPEYQVKGGTVRFAGQDLLTLSPDERARLGLFMAFQYPQEIPGVSIINFLRTAYNAVKGGETPVLEFRKLLYEKMDMLQIDRAFATRFVNDGFSGGEKKRNEILQMAMLEPKLAILDETDSGLDIDALRVVADGVNRIMQSSSRQPAVLAITHYNRLLDYLKPDVVHVFHKGRIVKSGGPELARELEQKGYDWVEDLAA